MWLVQMRTLQSWNNSPKHEKQFYSIWYFKHATSAKCIIQAGIFKAFRDPIRVPRISNRIPKIRKNRVARFIEIGSLQNQTGFLTFSLKKTCIKVKIIVLKIYQNAGGALWFIKTNFNLTTNFYPIAKKNKQLNSFYLFPSKVEIFLWKK